MKQPFFTIIAPTKERPTYLLDALNSVVMQNFKHFELIISNNGADEITRKIVQPFLTDERVKYLEQEQILNMPDHWNELIHYPTGKYLLYLTDRSVLKAGALEYLHNLIKNHDEEPEIISWGWDLYYEYQKILVPYPEQETEFKVLNNEKVLKDFAKNGLSAYPYHLPRGLNSATKLDYIKRLNTKYGKIFNEISPDYTFAFLCLLNTESMISIEKSLFISQGMTISDGGNSYNGDTSPYLNALNSKELFKFTPHKARLVHNTIYEDLLAMVDISNRNDLMSDWDKTNYYRDCLKEIDKKNEVGILPKSIIKKLNDQVLQALKKEKTKIKEAVQRSGTVIRCLKKIATYVYRSILPDLIKKPIYSFHLLAIRKGKYIPSVLQAANFKNGNKIEH